MVYDLYLLWIPNNGWGVFDACSCPDTSPFSNWMYRKYTIPIENHNEVFDRLIEKKEMLDLSNVIPAKGKEKEIFPELFDLLNG